MTDLRTISPDELPLLSELPQDARAVIFSPNGPLQALPYEKLLTKLIATNLAKVTKAVLDADLAHPADSVALVFNDGVATNNGWYYKIGASGAGNWTQFEELARNSRILAQAAAATAAAAVEGLDAATAAKIAEINLAGDAKILAAANEADRAEAALNAVDPMTLAAADAMTLVTAQAGVIGYRSTAGRMERHDAAGRWRRVPANRPRIWRSTNSIELIAEPAIPAGSLAANVDQASGGNNVVTMSGGSGVVRYAGAHTGPDLFQLGGRLSQEIDPGTSSFWTYGNMDITTTARARVCAWIVAGVASSGLTLRVGTQVNGTTTRASGVFNLTAAGDITVNNLGGVAQGGVRLVDTLADGRKLWMVWVDVLVAGVVEPFFQRGGTWVLGTDKFWLLGLSIQPDPAMSFTGAAQPTSCPVLDSGAFIADAPLVSPELMPANVHWIGSEVSVGVCASAAQAVGVPVAYTGRATVPKFERLIVFNGGASSQQEFLLPCPLAQSILSSGLIHRVGANPKGSGDRWFDVRFNQNSAGGYDFQGVYDDPALMPGLRSVSRSVGTGTHTIKKIVAHLRVADSDFAEASDAVFGSALRVQNGAADLEDVLAMGVNARAMVTPPIGLPGISPNPSAYITRNWNRIAGGRAFKINNPSTAATNNFRRVAVGSCQSGLIFSGTGGQTYTVNVDGYAQYEISADGLGYSSGRWNMTLAKVLALGNATPVTDAIQTQHEIEVDIGSGWQTLTAAGVSAANLPIGREFYRSGSHAAGVIDATGANDRLITVVTRWTNLNGVNTQRSGFQWMGTRVHDLASNVFFEVTDGSVWTSKANGPVSPANPRIRLRAMIGRYNAGPVWSATGAVAAANNGIHGDFIQGLSDGALVSFNASDVVVLGQGMQGYFLTGTGDTIDQNISRSILMVGQVNAYNPARSSTGAGGTKAISTTLIVSMDEGRRFSPAGAGNGANASFNLPGSDGQVTVGSGVWVATDGSSPTGVTTGGDGAIVSGTINTLAMGRIASLTTYTAPEVDQPSLFPITRMFEIAPLTPSFRVRADVMPDDLAFRQAFVDHTGVDWNDIVRAARLTYDFFRATFLDRLFIPTESYSVVQAAAIGTVVATGVRGLRILNGDMNRYFAVSGNSIVVARALPVSAATQAFGLELSDGRQIFVRVTP